MINTSTEFKSAIKADVIKAKARVTFNYTPPVIINDIINLDTIQRGEIALGCVQDDKINLDIKIDALTDAQYGQDNITVKVELGCMVNEAPEYCEIGTFKITKWSKNSYAILVELGTYVPDEDVKDILNRRDILLSEYITLGVSKLMGVAVSQRGIADSTLEQVYMYYKTIKQQLKGLAFAAQGIFRYMSTGLELSMYKPSAPVAILKEGSGELILNKEATFDYVLNKPIVSILKSKFIKSNQSNLFSLNTKLKGNDISTFSIDFSSPSLIKYLKINNKYAKLYDLVAGPFGCTLKLQTPFSAYQDVRIDMAGEQIQSSVLEAKDSNTTKYIENPYIQNTNQIAILDTRIYTGQTYSITCKANPALQVGDTVTLEGIGDMFITKYSMKFDGGLTGTLEGVLV